MNAARHGAALGLAACHAADAVDALAEMAEVLESANLELSEPLQQILVDVAYIAEEFVDLADGVGHAEVRRRAAA